MNSDDAAVRIHWLCSVLVDALKCQQGAGAWLTNDDQQTLVMSLAHSATPAMLQAILHDWFSCRESLLSVVGVNRELLLTEKLLTWERLMQPGALLPGFHL